MLVTSFYNMADTYFVGKINTQSTAAVGIVFSVMSIIQAVGFFFGHGSGNYISRQLGRHESGDAGKMAATGVTLAFLAGCVILALGQIFLTPLARLLGSTDTILPYARSYLRIILLGAPYMTASFVLNNQLRFQGSAAYGMVGIAAGAVLNVGLDPLLIFALDMGVAGAALATIISQFLSAAWVLRFLFSDRSILRLKRETMVLKKARVLKIVSMGMSSFAAGFTNSVVAVACNATLQTWGGDLYVGVMTVIHSVREIAENLVKGLTGGSQPVLGYNFGAGQYDRVKKAIRFLSVSTIAFTTFCWILISIFPESFIHIFNRDETLVQAAIPAVRVYFFGFFMMSLQYSGQACFIGLGKAKQATFFSIFRKVIIVLPLTLLFPRLGGLGAMGVFLAEPVSNFIGGAACYGTMLRTVWPELNKKKESA